ncbi:nucleotide sugar dehydrogenase [Leucobacter luti]|uniref:UDP-N-acetyl-D-glucosamine dehydrogenase n=1 Tax=Leucobacter luti TaxID=340320 RepID=A0A4V6MC10_9MICO|nr:nucleotide sugar dehydrogenase [Leucobacter luti]MBL3699739.1 nucleotide sugar dehydrogenase [Leucobacter luti]RZT62939.1 UDP-N-acetyl-D-glucosamine dehydrogenase [Leucobacter luti]
MTTSNTRKLIVIGQGYVGLPLAVRAVEAGYDVVGIDFDRRRIDALNQGESYVEDIGNDQLAAALATGRYRATDDYATAAGFDYAVITVPTPLKDALPDLSFIESSGASIAVHITPGATVVLESTTYPGTTQELLLPILESGSGLTAGTDFHVGYSPERIDPGNPKFSFKTTPKIVSGIDEASLERVNELFSDLVDRTVPVSTPREAEMAKLLENTFRHVNIALVNELAVFAHELGVNVWESIDAAATKPFGFMKFTPGPGVGGHCLPIDPSYLSWKVKTELGRSFRFVELANDVNEHMPDHVVQRAMHLLNDASKSLRGSTVVLVGIAYKKDSGDSRESPALRIIELLNSYGARVLGVDSHVEDHRWPEQIERVELTPEVVDAADIAIVVTDHSDIDLDVLVGSTLPVFDTRNSLQGPNVHRL